MYFSQVFVKCFCQVFAIFLSSIGQEFLSSICSMFVKYLTSICQVFVKFSPNAKYRWLGKNGLPKAKCRWLGKMVCRRPSIADWVKLVCRSPKKNEALSLLGDFTSQKKNNSLHRKRKTKFSGPAGHLRGPRLRKEEEEKEKEEKAGRQRKSRNANLTGGEKLKNYDFYTHLKPPNRVIRVFS